jgi:hypothetical protein
MTIGGLPVKYATKPIDLHITKRDCDKGQNKEPASCAAALACKREVDGCTDARVHLSVIYLKVGNKWLKYRTPQSIRSEVISFDRGAYFAPGEYRLMPFSESSRAREGRAHTLGAPKHGRPGHHRVKHHTVSGVRPKGANR